MVGCLVFSMAYYFIGIMGDFGLLLIFLKQKKVFKESVTD
jgi:hypothetical protein